MRGSQLGAFLFTNDVKSISYIEIYCNFMTIEFLKPTGTYTNAIKFSMNVPNLSGSCQLATQSNYSKNLLTLDLTIVETNDRYTEFSTNYTDELGDYDFTGFFDYTLYEDSIAQESGLVKLINNKSKSLDNQPKYTSPNDGAESYVIYE